MFLFFLPLIIIVASQIIYDVSAKAINEDINAYAGTTIIYSILTVFYFLIFVIFTPDASISVEFSKMNWAVVTFALGSIGLESGYIFLYRAGWNISLGGMVCNILLAMCMLGVGLLLFNENITFIQWCGFLFCLAGLIVVFLGGGNQKASAEGAHAQQKKE
jgi:drug/metabolite transporter (DMT)-like permease